MVFGTALVARLDSDGDVLLAGPAVRAVAAQADRVVLLAGPRGRQAAELLPGVDEVLCWRTPWIDPSPPPVRESEITALVDTFRSRRIDTALILTSYHQCPLPLALLLRLAGVPRIAAISEDYPGSLLDVRHKVAGDPPEAVRNLSLAAAAGFPLPPGDDGRLAVRQPLPAVADLVPAGRYLAVHPGTSVPARAWDAAGWAGTVELLADRGHQVVVTGSEAERPLTRQVAGSRGIDLGGRTSFPRLAAVLAGADVLAVANTGPAHLAAAVGTPVVSLFAPTVPVERWAPYRVPRIVLGDQQAPCRNSYQTTCPVPGHPCLNTVRPAEVVRAMEALREEYACAS